MVDANQAWDAGEARAMSAELAEFEPRWLEEPIAADQPLSAWQQLARDCEIPLAAGENLRGIDAFDAALARRVGAIQPTSASGAASAAALKSEKWRARAA